MSVNSRFRQFRTSLGINQVELADNIGVKQAAISNYEKEDTPIPDYILIILKLKYNLNESWLRNNEGEMFSSKDYKVIDQDQIMSEPLLTIDMQTEIEFLRTQVAELNATVRDQAASLRDYAAAEKDNARSRVNLTETVITQAQAIANLTSGKAGLKKASGGV